jgi:hypothetical protein
MCGLASSGGSRLSRIELLRSYYFACRPSNPGSFPGRSSGLSNVGSASGDERPRESSCSWRTSHQPHPTSPTRTDCQRGCDHGRSGLRLDRTSRLEPQLARVEVDGSSLNSPVWRSTVNHPCTRAATRCPDIGRVFRVGLRVRPELCEHDSKPVAHHSGISRRHFNGNRVRVLECPKCGLSVRTTDNMFQPARANRALTDRGLCGRQRVGPGAGATR